MRKPAPTQTKIGKQAATTGLLLLAGAMLLVPLTVKGAGGEVTNVVPTVNTFSNIEGTTANDASTDIFSGIINDTNGEADLVSLKILTTSGPSVTSEYILSASDLTNTTEPGSYTNGWKVWNPTADDGLLSFKYQYTYATDLDATFVWDIQPKDEDVYQASGMALTVDVNPRITLVADPYTTAGVVETGISWGNWTAIPRGANIDALNYVKITNSGFTPGQQFTIDFNEAVFTGADNATFTIPIDNNIQFYAVEKTGVTAPGALGSFGSTQGAGSETFTYTATGNHMYVAYRIIDMPDVLKDQSYTATFTVTPV